MPDDYSYLFVYGTLLDQENPYGAYLKENSCFYQKGRFKGKLYNIGNYPGAIVDTHTEGFVYGSIFKMEDPKSTLCELDEYEGFGDNSTAPNEFVRELIETEADNDSLKCWVYLYNLPIKGLPQIISGHYLQH